MSLEAIVYMVDDDPGVLKALTRLLHTEAYTVRAFASAEEFLLAHDPLVPGCIVLDIHMPNIDGLALQEALLASASERFIIFVTGHGDIATSVQAMKAGAVDFLTKPFHDEDFLAAVRSAIAKDEQARKVRSELQSIRWRMDTLTPREHQVMQHVVAGRLNKQIAAISASRKRPSRFIVPGPWKKWGSPPWRNWCALPSRRTSARWRQAPCTTRPGAARKRLSRVIAPTATAGGIEGCPGRNGKFSYDCCGMNNTNRGWTTGQYPCSRPFCIRTPWPQHDPPL